MKHGSTQDTVRCRRPVPTINCGRVVCLPWPPVRALHCSLSRYCQSCAANRVPPIVCRQSCAADRVLPIECCQLIVVVVLLDEGYVDLRTIAEASLPTLQEDVTTIKKPQLRAILAAAQRVSAPMWTARNLNDHHAPLQAMASVFDIIMDPKKRAEHLKGKVIVCLPDISVLSWLMADCSTPGQPGLTRD